MNSLFYDVVFPAMKGHKFVTEIVRWVPKGSWVVKTQACTDVIGETGL